MSKRTLSSSAPSTPKQKRTKIADNQSNLERFFSRSPEKRSSKPSSSRSAIECAETSFFEDQRHAAAFAGEEGLGLEVTRLLEEEWKQSQREDITTFQSGNSSPPVRLKQNLPQRPAGSSKKSRNPTLGSPGLSETLGFTSNPVQPPEYTPLTPDPLTFVLHEQPWPANTAAPYSFLAHALSTISKTKSRITIINALTNTLRSLTKYDPSSLLPALYLLSNTLSPPYSAVELGLGPSIISKAIQQISGLGPSSIKRLYTQTGDAGDVAFEAKSNLRTLLPHPPLLITAVYSSLLKIANAKGPGATKQKQAIIEKLLVAAKGEEARFLTRTLVQNLRVGALRTSILTALARAMVLTLPPHAILHEESPYHVPEIETDKHEVQERKTDNRDEIKSRYLKAERLITRVFVQHPNYADIVTALLAAGLDGLAERVPLTVGIPLHPTLGSPIRSIDEIYERLGDLPFAAELKYDGQRAQIHGLKDDLGKIAVHIFSRHLEDMTTKYPDVLSLFERIFETSPQTSSFIIDSEIAAIDPSDGDLRSFQELSNRARKEVQLQNVTIMVGVFAFDLMYLDGEILLEEPFRKRRSLLRARFPPVTIEGVSRFTHVESCDSENGRDEIEDFWGMAIESKCEGLMIKLLDHGEVVEDPAAVKDRHRRKPLPATYEPDKRTFAWLKLKKDYVKGLGDSLDLVPLGAWHGNGRKARWWSPILLGLRDPTAGRLVAVCKCMSGFSDEFYKALAVRYPEDSDTCSRQPSWDCDTGGLKPEVYFKPQEVWEIRGADVTLSPVSVAALGLVSESRGLSLRFPRFIRVRDDKTIEQASTAEFLAQMWRDQQRKGKDQVVSVDDGDLIDIEVGEDLAEDLEEDSD